MPEGTEYSELVKYGPGYVLAVIMFVVWIFEKKSAIKEKQNMIDALQSVLNKRDSQRDETLKALTEIGVYLKKADLFENFARETMDSLVRPSPKRRILDRKLAEAVAKVDEEIEHPENHE